MSRVRLALLALLLTALAPTRLAPIAPARAQPSSSPPFAVGDRCVLSGALLVRVEDAPARDVPAGTPVEVTLAGRRFTEVRARPTAHTGVQGLSVQGLVENARLAEVCVLERPRCVVTTPLAVRGIGKGKHAGRVLRVQPGGSLVVMSRDDERAHVRVGDVDAAVAVKALVAACPPLAAVFARQDEERRRRDAEAPSSRPGRRPPP